MDNVLLGKVVKAMYKLSGKTLPQLSEETGLTLDTINNLFYARLQKPGYFGVSAFVKATGYMMADLDGFIAYAKDLPANADIVDEFTKYLLSEENSAIVADKEKQSAAITEPAWNDNNRNIAYQIQALNEQHDRQMDLFRATHVNYVEQLKESYQEQIEQLEESNVKLKAHYDHSVAEIKKSHERELNYEKDELKHARRMNMLMAVCIALEAVGLFVLGICLAR